jgi:two-component system sensor histidine kinase HydH
LIKRSNVEVRFTPKSVSPVVSQQVQLTQILNSLFANALEAMPKGGVLSIDVESTSPGQVSLMIDTGKGMTNNNNNWSSSRSSRPNKGALV